MMAKSIDVDNSNVVHKSELNFLSSKKISMDCTDKIKYVLDQHVTNFTPTSNDTKQLIKQIRQQNRSILKQANSENYGIE